MEFVFRTGKGTTTSGDVPVIEQTKPIAPGMSVVGSEAVQDAYERDFISRNFIGASGGTLGIVTPVNWMRQAIQAEKLSLQNGIYHRILEIMRDGVLGNGIKKFVKARRQDLKPYEKSIEDIIQKCFWGQVNRVDLHIGQWIFEQFMNGEFCSPVLVHPTNGFCTIGYLPGRWVSDVQLNPRNFADAYKIRVEDGEWIFDVNNLIDGGKMDYSKKTIDDWYDVIRYDADPYIRDEKGKIKFDKDGKALLNGSYMSLNGNAFYFRTGNLIGQKRGQGDGFPIADWVITLEQGIRDFLLRYDAQAALVYDLLIKGASDDEIKEKWARIVLPTGRIPFAHNESVELTLHSPTIRIEDLTSFIRTLVVLIAGAAGVPEFMMGDGSQTNVATAQAQGPVLWAKFQNRRTLWEAQLGVMVRFVVEQANKCGRIYATNPDGTKGEAKKLTAEDLDEIEMGLQFEPFERGDKKDQSDFVTGLVAACLAAEQAGYIDHEDGRTVVRAAFASFGLSTTDESLDASKKQGSDQTDPLKGKGASGEDVDMSALK